MTPQRLAEGMLAHGIGEIENDGFETLLVGPLHLTNRSIHVLERHQRGADEFTAIFSHDLQYREVVRARHRGRQLRLDQVRPPAGELGTDHLNIDAEPGEVFKPRLHVAHAVEVGAGAANARQRCSPRNLLGFSGKIAVPA